MEESNVKELSKYRFEKAQNNLKVAKSLFNDKVYGVALNRAYYSAFDAMRAVNALNGFDSSKHSGVIAYFNREYVKTGIFPSESSAIIKRASMLREKSDYEDFYEPTENDAKTVISEVEIFLNEIAAFLTKKSIL